ncbi:MAG: metallophosphoesterase [Gemmatimonadetes bacterium]|nr:metallophosphoesterase [Gemmatimonadota bacterium]
MERTVTPPRHVGAPPDTRHHQAPEALPLEERLSPGARTGRANAERARVGRPFGLRLPFRRWFPHRRARAILMAVFRGVGLEGAGRREASNLAIRDNRIRSQRLPAAFHGTRILHLSDLHLDTTPGILHSLVNRIGSLSFDCSVITGDLNSFAGSFCEKEARLLRRALGACPAYVSLGNHDSLVDAARWEACGFTILVNERISWERDEDRLTIAAIDDVHYLESPGDSIASLASGSFGILLSHTPDVYREAAHAGFDVMFSGHTHGGQICAPGGFPLLRNAKAPRAFCAGAWSYLRLRGYTSRGVGCSGLPLRFHCPPEIVLHTIVREEYSPA